MSFFLTTILKQLKNNHFFIPPFHKLHINKCFSVFLLTFRDYTKNLPTPKEMNASATSLIKPIFRIISPGIRSSI